MTSLYYNYSNNYCYCQVKSNEKCYNFCMVYFKDRLRELRIERGVTQEEVGKAVNTSKMAVSHWEKGHSTEVLVQKQRK